MPEWISCRKRIARLKVAITVVLVDVPVDAVRARLQDHAKHAPGGSPVFRGEAVRNRLEFCHRIGYRVDYHIVDALRCIDTAAQASPANINVSVRIASPGTDGAVTQANAAGSGSTSAV